VSQWSLPFGQSCLPADATLFSGVRHPLNLAKHFHYAWVFRVGIHADFVVVSGAQTFLGVMEDDPQQTESPFGASLNAFIDSIDPKQTLRG
jgi:hypothetical protein